MSTLVEILARELDAWPEGAEYAEQDQDKEVRFAGNNCVSDFFAKTLAEEDKAISDPHDGIPWAGQVTREMWEAERERIAGPHQWTGEGLPPVGTVCEVREASNEYSVFKRWTHCTYLAMNIGRNEMQQHVIRDDRGDVAILYEEEVPEFRPIRTDRDKWIEAALALDCDPCDGMLSRKDFCGKVYDTMIAKLPGDGE